MNRIKNLFWSFLILASLSAPAQEKMNVLFIAVDDLKPVLGCYGDKYAITPNIDTMAQRGTVFMKNYCQQAICGATRPSLMTGLRPDQIGIWGNKYVFRDLLPDVVTLAQNFKEQGYWSASIGKIYHEASMDQMQDKKSWDVYIGSYDFPQGWGTPAPMGYVDPLNKARIARFLDQEIMKGELEKGLDINTPEMIQTTRKMSPPQIEAADAPDEAYIDGQIALTAEKLLKQAAQKDEPFFLAVGFYKPHVPFVAPKKYYDLYDPQQFKLAEYQQMAANSPKWAYYVAGDITTYNIPGFEPVREGNLLRVPEQIQRKLIHGYYACTSFMDAQVGKVMKALQENGLDKNTIVILWGDHGWHLGDHSLWSKSTTFEQGTRSPMIIIDPRSGKAIHSDQLTEFVDIYPTLCDLAGISMPDKLAGKSLRPIIYGKDKPVKKHAVSQFPRGGYMGYSMRTDRYRYIVWMDNKAETKAKFDPADVVAEEFYDYLKDPQEKVSLQNDPAYKKEFEKHRAEFIEFFDKERLL